jgi:hypothetical protein
MNEHEPKLKVGDKIRIIGFPMLAKLEDGKVFTVKRIYTYANCLAYSLHSGKTKIGHYVHSVDRCIRDGSDLNRIEVVK